MKKNPVISIIIPVYNSEEYLKCCLDSVIQSSYTKLDIIIIDDCSTDNSFNICNSYIKKDKRIVLKKNKHNMGVCCTRNIGVEMASGEYVTFLDADDYVSASHYQDIVDELIKEKTDILILGWTIFQINKSRMIVSRTKMMKKKKMSFKEAMNEMMEGNGFNFVLWDKVYCKELFNYPLTTDRSYGSEDVFWNVQLMYRAKCIRYVPLFGYNYRLLKNSLSHKMVTLKQSEHKFCEKMISDYINTGLSSWIYTIYARYLLIFYIRLLKSSAPLEDVIFIKGICKKYFKVFINNQHLQFLWKIRLSLTVILPVKMTIFILVVYKYIKNSNRW